MTEAQQVALRHPILIAYEKRHPRYLTIERQTPNAWAALVLTVNAGYE